MVWDEVRALHDLGKEEYNPAEKALQRILPGSSILFWQPKNESFPPSGNFDLIRVTDPEPTLESDYSGIIDSSLAAVYIHSEAFTTISQESLYVTGGATDSPEIMNRTAAIWNREVVPIEKGGPALGAAVAGAYAACKAESLSFDIEQFSQQVLKRGKAIAPNPATVAAYHNPNGYLEQFRIEEAKIISQHPIE